MTTRWTFETPEAEERPKGPLRAREEAVALLAPFNFIAPQRPGLDTSERLEFDPKTWATAQVDNLAGQLNALLYRARHAPRAKEIFATMKKLRETLQDVSRQIASLDDWTRLHLEDPFRVSGLDAGLLPPIADPRAGDFADLADEFAVHVGETMTRLQAFYGDNDVADRGGRQNHDERFAGTAKTRFVREAFDLFDSYHPGSAKSTEGGPFHTFVHKVYEYATGKYDENRVALSHLLRSLITPLKQYRAADQGYWAIEEKLSSVAPDSAEYRDLSRQQHEFYKQKEALEAVFVPNLGRVAGGQPARKGRR